MKDLRKRILTAAVAAPVGAGLIYIGGIPFIVGVILISIVCTYEYLHMFKNIGIKSQYFMAIISNVILLSVFSFTLLNQGLKFASLALLCAMIVLDFAIMVNDLFRESKHPLSTFPAVISSQLYITFSFLCLITLRFIDGSGHEFIPGGYGALENPTSAFLILTVFVSIWTNDSMAYFGGSIFGKHPLYPSVSPKKTWEGAISGFIFGTAGFVGLGMLYLDFPLLHLIVLGALINIICQIGDLFESKLKRHSGLKDSSNLLPGHGGFLDRLDGVIFVMPTVLMFVLIVSFFSL